MQNANGCNGRDSWLRGPYISKLIAFVSHFKRIPKRGQGFVAHPCPGPPCISNKEFFFRLSA